MSRRVVIYTDGGADPNPGIGGWAAVLIHEPTKETKEISGGEASTTNNRMELTAALEALRSLKGACEVELFTDSTYLRQGITRWVRGWRAAGWRRRDGQPVKNVDLWRSLDAAAEVHEIRWQWVKGHAGHRYNERADELASAEIESRRLQGVSEALAPSSSGDDRTGNLFLKVTRSASGSAWAALIRDEHGEETELAQRGGDGTVNQVELQAACALLDRTEAGSRWRFFTTSEYLRKGAVEWLQAWKQNQWRTREGAQVKNAELWLELESRLLDRVVTFPVVKKGEVVELDLLTKIARGVRDGS